MKIGLASWIALKSVRDVQRYPYHMLRKTSLKESPITEKKLATNKINVEQKMVTFHACTHAIKSSTKKTALA